MFRRICNNGKDEFANFTYENLRRRALDREFDFGFPAKGESRKNRRRMLALDGDHEGISGPSSLGSLGARNLT